MKFDWILNRIKERIYPYTHIDAVIVDESGTKLSDTISEINEKLIIQAEGVQSDWNESDSTSPSFILNKPSSIPTDGGNADTLEGKSSDYFASNDDLELHILNTDLHIPSGGEVGQILTKTAEGNGWTDVSSGGEGGVTDYTLLSNLPKINNVTVVGNKELSDYGITATAIGVEEGANNYIHPSYPIKESGLYKISVDNFGHVNNVTPVTKDDIISLGIPSTDTNTTYSVATHETDGLMDSQDKVKIDNTPNFIFSTTVPTELPENTICFVYEE